MTKRRKRPHHVNILWGLAIGVLAGVAVNLAVGGSDPSVAAIIAHVTEPIGQLFLRLLLMVVVPLVFSSLVVGVAGIGIFGRSAESASNLSRTRL